jgi:hypothetical protein
LKKSFKAQNSSRVQDVAAPPVHFLFFFFSVLDWSLLKIYGHDCKLSPASAWDVPHFREGKEKFAAEVLPAACGPNHFHLLWIAERLSTIHSGLHSSVKFVGTDCTPPGESFWPNKWSEISCLAWWGWGTSLYKEK